jgi:hypothetical protein
MSYCINEPGCLGDILFTIKIAEKLSEDGEVFWNIAPCFWESGINRVQTSEKVHIGPNVERFVSDAQQIKLTDLTDRSDSNLMIKKYESVNIEWEDWKDYLNYTRDLETEKNLKEFLGIVDGEKFILVNEYYGNNQIHLGVKKGIPENYPGKVIEFKVFNEATIFDWCSIFEEAEEIHTVDTSIQFVIETLELKASKLVVHPRHYLYTEPQVAPLFKKPWEWIKYDRDTWRILSPMEKE